MLKDALIQYKPVLITIGSTLSLKLVELLAMSKLGTQLIQLLIGICTLIYIIIKTIKLLKKK